jgi:hypothetical protein
MPADGGFATIADGPTSGKKIQAQCPNGFNGIALARKYTESVGISSTSSHPTRW